MTIDWTRAVVVSTTEFDVVWELLDLDRTPVVLELPSPGATHRERGRIIDDALASLAGRGLARGSSPVRGLAADLTTLARAETVQDLMVLAPARCAGIAATVGTTCVLAVRIDDRVALVRIPPEHAATCLVELLGPVRPGPGSSIRVPARALADAVAATGDDRDRFPAELLRRGLDGAEVAAVLRMDELVGAAQLGAGTGRTRAPGPLQLRITEHGFYRQRQLPAPDDDGDALVEAGPVDAATLVRELEELAASLGPGQRRGAGRGSTRPAAAGGIGSVVGASTRWDSGSSTSAPDASRYSSSPSGPRSVT